MTIATGSRLGPYEILAPLGAGGMGEVYRARDRKLDRDVAIKVLPESVAADPEALARFGREARAVAALSHPNILSIFDFGSEGETAYAVMELLEGETLRGRLEAGPISQKEAMDYALQIGKGLAAAHEKGIVHRDLKPENLFVTRGGHLKILDFGLAKRVGVAQEGDETKASTISGHTEPGTVMGTVGYMSPEQVRGLPVDHRSDLFSFGAILYELFSGRRAFKRDTAIDTLSAILNEEPPELVASGRRVAPALDRVVRRCLEKNRERRFRSAADVVFALEEAGTASPGPASAAAPLGRAWKAAVAAVVFAGLAAAGVWLWRRPSRPARPAVTRVAVLPFDNLGSPEDDYFADGMADEVRSKLGSLRGVEVIARSSSTPYKKTTKTPREIARELDVQYLLTATVRWQKGPGANRVHVTPELVEVGASGAPAGKWRQQFDAALTDVFQVQSDIAARAAQGLGVALGAADAKRLAERPTQNLAAYDAFLKGEEAFQAGSGESDSLRKQQTFYEQAVALDPGFTQAWVQLARTTAWMFANSPTPELEKRSRQAAEKVAELAPGTPQAFYAQAIQLAVVGHDYERAQPLLLRGVALAPNDADLLRTLGSMERNMGKFDAAVGHLRQAERVNPRSAWNPDALATVLLFLRRYGEAREAIDRGLAIEPGSMDLIMDKVWLFAGQGDLEGARAVLREAAKTVEPTSVVIAASRGWVAWALDEEQQQLLLRLPSSAFDDDVGVWALALASASHRRGDPEKARAHAEEARKVYEEALKTMPDAAPGFYAELGLALAYLGRKEEAIREGQRAVSLVPAKELTAVATQLETLAEIYVLVGETEKAIDTLEQLVGKPSVFSPAWLGIDPTFAALRKSPRFQRLVKG
jgi:TolB-like protein/Flp pilus assembly protein TadD